MSLSYQIHRAAQLAQLRLAQQGGMTEGTNALYNGEPLIAVFGAPVVEERMNAGGGWVPRALVPATLTRDQLATAPAPHAQFVRTDLGKPITYRIESVDVHDPLVWVLTLLRLGD